MKIIIVVALLINMIRLIKAHRDKSRVIDLIVDSNNRQAELNLKYYESILNSGEDKDD